MKLSDAHMHLFAGGFRSRAGALFPNGGELQAYLKKRYEFNIRSALVIGYEGERWSAGNNCYIAKLSKTHRWIVPLAHVHIHHSPTPILKLRKAGFFGISLYVSSAEIAKKIAEWPDEIFDALNAQHAIISINVSAEISTSLTRILKRLCKSHVLLSHLGMPGIVNEKLSLVKARKLLSNIRNFAELPHVGVKLSGFYACGPLFCRFSHLSASNLVTALHEKFGDERLYWGSDFAVALDFISFHQTLEPVRDYFSEKSFPLVAGENLQRIIRSVR